MPLLDAEFALIEGGGSWTFSDPSDDHYYQQKNIRLHRNGKPELDATPEPLSSPLPSSLFEDAIDDRRWRYFFERRVKAAREGASDVPVIFPGDFPIIHKQADGAFEAARGGSSLQLERLTRLEALFLGEGMRKGADSGVAENKIAGNSVWPWRFIDEPQIRPLHDFGRLALAHQIAPLKQLAAEIEHVLGPARPGRFTVAAVRKAFELIHNAWAFGSRCIDYDERALQFCSELLAHESGSVEALLGVLFELELFSSYTTVLSGRELIGSGFYSGCWIDVMALDPFEVRASEQCDARRVLDELVNLCHGKTAPIVVNEYGCVADGNHRLAAVTIWKLLHECGTVEWALEDDAFQRLLAEKARDRICSKTLFLMHEALRCLGSWLADEKVGKELSGHRATILGHTIDRIPAIPLLEYTNLTAVASEYEKSKSISRFLPHVYELLEAEPDLALGLRACFHFADRVPLPWFAVASKKH